MQITVPLRHGAVNILERTETTAVPLPEPPAAGPVSLEKSWKAFRERCFSMNLSRKTLNWYGYVLRPFTIYMQGTLSIERANDVVPRHLREYLSHLRESGKAPETIFGSFRVLRCFFRFLHRDGLILTNPMTSVDCPRRERRLIRPLSMSQTIALLKQPDISTTSGLRDKTMMLLMLDSGLRLLEVLTLRTDQINWMDGVITVFGKGSKERMIPFAQTTRQALQEYARVRMAAGPGAFFVGRSGQGLRNRNIQERIRRYGKAAEIKGVRVSPHTLRHTFAVQYVKNGGDPFSLQAILGHSTLDMVRNYVNLARRDVSEQHKKFSPMDKIFVPKPGG